MALSLSVAVSVQQPLLHAFHVVQLSVVPDMHSQQVHVHLDYDNDKNTCHAAFAVVTIHSQSLRLPSQ
jgi:hypothetical protein